MDIMKETDLLSQLARRVRTASSEEAVFNFLLNKAIDYIGADAGTIALFEKSDGHFQNLVFKYTYGEKENDVRGIQLSKEKGVVGWVVSNGEPLIVNDVRSDPRFYPGVDKMSGFQTESILCTPIKVDKRVIGAVELLNKKDGPFSRNDMILLSTMVDIAALSIKSTFVRQDIINQRDYYAGIMDSLSEGVLILDRDLTILDVNQFFQIFLNKSPEEIIGRTCQSVFSEMTPSCADFFKDVKIFEMGKDFSLKWTLKNADNALFHFKVSGTPLAVQDEIVTSVLLTFTDITQIEHLHGLMKASEAKYREITEKIYESWYLHDMDGRFVEVNPAVEKTTGYTKEELLTMCIQDLIADPYKDQFKDYLKSLKQTGEAEGLIRIVNKQGEDRLMEYRNWILHHPDLGQVSRGLVRDVTDRRRLKTQLRHAQRMESMGTIASGISHNFRNILTGIMTNSQLVQLKYKGDADLQKYMSEIIKLTKTGSDLITSLLQFSRKGSGDPKAVINLIDVLQEVFYIISRAFDKKIQIRTEWPEIIPIYGDRSALSQVFMNLCTNARDAMPEGGVIDILAREEGKRALVSIADTGCGMDPKTLSMIFDPFFTTKGDRMGTGLGLSTAYGIIKNHGGDIRINSEPQQGSSFEISLPLPKALALESEARPPNLVYGSGQKVLIVDDDETVLEPMKELLEGLGYRANYVNSGQKAIEYYKTWNPNAVLLDRNMPEMDGLATAQNILALDPQAEIILLSGYDQKGPDGIDEEISRSIKGYITKPFDIAEVGRILGEMFR